MSRADTLTTSRRFIRLISLLLAALLVSGVTGGLAHPAHAADAPGTPRFTKIPTEVTVREGGTALFDIGFDAAGYKIVELVFQRKANPGYSTLGTVKSAAHVFEVPNVTLDMDGEKYRIIGEYKEDEESRAKRVFSEEIPLKVTTEPAPPSFITQPTNVTVTEGQEASFSVGVLGSPRPTIAWESRKQGGKWTPIAGATGVTLTLPDTSVALSGTEYRASATNKHGGPVWSKSATLTVKPRPAMAPTVVSDLPEEPAIVVLGKTTQLSIEATARPRPAITWERSQSADFAKPIAITADVATGDWDPATGHVSSTLTIAGTKEGTAWYRARVANGVGKPAVTRVVAVTTVARRGQQPVIIQNLPREVVQKLGDTPDYSSIDFTGEVDDFWAHPGFSVRIAASKDAKIVWHHRYADAESNDYSIKPDSKLMSGSYDAASGQWQWSLDMGHIKYENPKKIPYNALPGDARRALLVKRTSEHFQTHDKYPQAHYGQEVWAVITDGDYSVTTARSKWYPGWEPRVLTQPRDTQFDKGGAVDIAAAFESLPTGTLQWQRSTDGRQFTTIANQTKPSLHVTEGGYYRAVATNRFGSVTTKAARVTANDAPAGSPLIITHPADASAPSSYSTSVKFAATAKAAPKVDSASWEYSTDAGATWQKVPEPQQALTQDPGGNQTSTLVIDERYSYEAIDKLIVKGAQFRVAFTAGGVTRHSNPATLTVTPGLKAKIITPDPYHRGDTVKVHVTGALPGKRGKPDLATWATVVDSQGRFGEGIPYPDINDRQPDANGEITLDAWIPYVVSGNTSERFPVNDLRVQVHQGQPGTYQMPIYYTHRFNAVDRSDQFTTPTLGIPTPVAGAAGDWVTSTVTYTGGEGTRVSWRYQPGGAQTGNDQIISDDRVTTANGVSTVRFQLSDRSFGGTLTPIADNDAGRGVGPAAEIRKSAPPVLTKDLPESLIAGVGIATELTVAADTAPHASVTWQRSSDGKQWTDLSEGVSTDTTKYWVTTSTLRFTPQASDDATRYRAVLKNTAGEVTTKTLTLKVADGDVPVAITEQPASQTIEAGEKVTFSAAATGVPTPSVTWQRSKDGGTTWADLRGATGTSYVIEKTSTDQDGWLYRAMFTNTASPKGVATNPAKLTVTPRNNVRTHCGTSYGLGAGKEFCFRGPEKVIFGQDIVIEGVSGYLAADDTTGSVVNFFLDALFSGDPNTVFSKNTFTNPATGAKITDHRTNAVVQAKPDGTWKATVPWPTIAGISKNADGTGDWTQEEIDKRFAPGTSHSIRMLTGSLMTGDRQRGASLFFTVVKSLDEEIGVTEPVYEHQTLTSKVPGDKAVAWVPSNVDSGGSFPLSGTGWLTKDQQWGSRIMVRLLSEKGKYYQRSGEPNDLHADSADPTVWQVIQAPENGEIATSVEMPKGLKGGNYLAVELTTIDDGTPTGDVARKWASETLRIDELPYIPPVDGNATCTAKPSEYSFELAPGMAVPAANVGGTIRLVGKNFCNLVGGGSLVAIKINAGGYSHLPTVTAAHYDANLGREVGESPATISKTNKTIWYVIEADKHGSFDVNVPLPTRTNSTPTFGEGSYTLQLLTRTISADPYYKGSRPDPSRSLQTKEFTVVAEGVPVGNVKPGRPQASPEPLHITNDLTAAARGGVQVTMRPTQWVVTVPKAKPGDWVYVNVYDGATPRFPWNTTWFEVNAKRQVTVPLAGATVPTGTNKVSVQDRNGALLGWTSVKVSSPSRLDTKTDTRRPPNKTNRPSYQPNQPGPMRGDSGNSLRRTQRPATNVQFAMYAPVLPTKPATTPTQPVPSYAELTAANVGGATGTTAGGKLTVTLPSVPGGHWVFLYLYTQAGKNIPIDWVQVGTDHTITVDVGQLPDGVHKLAFLDGTGKLVGWVTANGPRAAVPGVEPDQIVMNPPQATVQQPQSQDTAQNQLVHTVASPAGDSNWTFILIGAALLVLAGAGTGIITLSAPRRTKS